MAGTAVSLPPQKIACSSLHFFPRYYNGRVNPWKKKRKKKGLSHQSSPFLWAHHLSFSEPSLAAVAVTPVLATSHTGLAANSSWASTPPCHTLTAQQRPIRVAVSPFREPRRPVESRGVNPAVTTNPRGGRWTPASRPTGRRVGARYFPGELTGEVK